ncbi:MAG: DnaJ domain-containing protein [Myxococcota bacterium]|nr:DnaJ domain-containing protein [Myxococcota bacterium]
MHLPGRLRGTTLGDLLGVLHRAACSGTLEVVEDRGRTHRVHLARGLVVAVEIDGASPSLAEILRRDRLADDDVLRRSLLRAIASRRLHGQVLIDDFCLSPALVGTALRRQVVARLAVIEQLADARLAFRVALRPPRGALHAEPLQPREFLHGRRRARERGGVPWPSTGADAWRILGLRAGAEVSEIKRAYRQLARSLHPDLHPAATDEERRVLQTRFAEATDAYRALVA